MANVTKQASTRFSIVRRSKGQSAVEKASYISRSILVSEFDGQTYRPKYHEDLVHSEITLPPNAPKEYADRATLWNAVELAEKGQKSQLARMLKASLPNEWSYELAEEVVRDYVQRNFVDKGMCADWAIHDSENDKGQRNLHIHVMLMPEGFAANGERMKEKTEAEKVAEECRLAGTATVVKAECRDRAEKPPALYDLTSLQRDANRQLGFTAQQTLDYTQSLYEKKLVTYPRTDSRYLTEDMAGMLPGLVDMVQEKRGISPEAPVPVNAAQVINGKKVTDHHAIIPTKTLESADLAALPSGELAVLDLIAMRLVCAVGGPCRYSETAVTLECAGHQFKSKGRTVTDPGWRAYAAADGEKDGDDAPPIPALSEDAKLPLARVDLKEGRTTPPKRFTEDTLLQSMETAGAGEMSEDVERKGIGTPATRAAIIEKLVQKGFVERKGDKKAKALVPTDKGRALAAVVPEQIQSPAMTAEWEEKLLGIEKGGYAPDDFMREIAGMVTDLVKNYETVKGVEIKIPGGSRVIGSCPRCGADVAERDKGWFCASRECRFVLWKDNAYFKKIGKHLTAGMAEKLVKEGRVKLKDCKSQRTGRTYNADVLLTTEEDGRVKFQMEFDNSKKDSGGKKN